MRSKKRKGGRKKGRYLQGGAGGPPIARPVNTSKETLEKAKKIGECMDLAQAHRALPSRRDFDKASKNTQEKYARCLHNDVEKGGCGGSPLQRCRNNIHFPAEREKDIACWRRCLDQLHRDSAPIAPQVPYQPGIYPIARPVATGSRKKSRRKSRRRKSRRRKSRRRKSRRRKSRRRKSRRKSRRQRRKRIKGVKWEDRMRKSGRFTNKPSYKRHQKHRRQRNKSRKRPKARGRKTRRLLSALGLNQSESAQRQRLLKAKQRKEGAERMDIVANARKVIQTKKRNLKRLERGILPNTTRSVPQLRETTRSRRRHRRHRRRHTRKLREKLNKDIQEEKKHLKRMTTNIYTPTDYSPAKEIDAERVVLEVQEAVREGGPEYSANRARVDDLFLKE